ncbi:MAG: DUF1329 domain-containing protein [Chromatiales bacterium]|nr:DUF1329 domain-containing protein [Chromatiales bacterium]MDH3946141.1 DUF1329 domain-containing protein [Chromatiales bacterium]MDH4013701.1 DUF1329 domain-containing protein [Chromatiales bacterium]
MAAYLLFLMRTPAHTYGGLGICVFLLAMAWPAVAEVSAAEAARLGGGELTPLGAERAGNAAGTIPAWTGGITEMPPGYVPGRHHVDPFADDPVLYSIDAANLGEHADKLTDGQKALLAAYPDTLHFNVYPTRRSASYPAWVYEAIRENATSATLLTAGKGGVEGAHISSPFPMPKSAEEVIWNHNLRWRGIRVKRREGSAAVTRMGRYQVVRQLQDFAYPYGSPRVSEVAAKFDNVLLAVKAKTYAPALRAGEGVLVIETINQTRDPRKSWRYTRSLRRIIRLPYFGYEVPPPGLDGLRTVDDFELYNGPPDRYEWTLHGKREILIPYNAYRLHSDDVTPEQIIQRKHVNPELLRYELHRVWVVEGRLKEGARHVYSRRIFYVDEDSWQIAISEAYDRDGKFWRVMEAHAVNYYEVPVLWATAYAFYDLQQERYLINGLDNGLPGFEFSDGADPREFSPNALSYYIR